MELYYRKPVPVMAMQWDGTVEGATKIIDVVLEKYGVATYHSTIGEEHILVNAVFRLNPNGWLILRQDGQLFTVEDVFFAQNYYKPRED